MTIIIMTMMRYMMITMTTKISLQKQDKHHEEGTIMGLIGNMVRLVIVGVIYTGVILEVFKAKTYSDNNAYLHLLQFFTF